MQLSIPHIAVYLILNQISFFEVISWLTNNFIITTSSISIKETNLDFLPTLCIPYCNVFTANLNRIITQNGLMKIRKTYK